MNSPCTAIVATLAVLACTSLASWLVVHRHRSLQCPSQSTLPRRAQARARGARLDHLTADFTDDFRGHFGPATAAA